MEVYFATAAGSSIKSSFTDFCHCRGKGAAAVARWSTAAAHSAIAASAHRASRGGNYIHFRNRHKYQGHLPIQVQLHRCIAMGSSDEQHQHAAGVQVCYPLSPFLTNPISGGQKKGDSRTNLGKCPLLCINSTHTIAQRYYHSKMLLQRFCQFQIHHHSL